MSRPLYLRALHLLPPETAHNLTIVLLGAWESASLRKWRCIEGARATLNRLKTELEERDGQR